MKDIQTGKPNNHRFGFGLMPLAFLFLFNPDVSVIDILPDIFGYIILAACIGGMADLSQQLETARKSFVRMIFVSAAKLISIFWLFGLSTAEERPVSMLLFSFVFSTIELIILIPAWNGLFDGILYLCTSTKGSFALSENKSGKSVTTVMKHFTVAFLIIKAFFTLLPEFSALSEQTYEDKAFYWYEYINLYRIIAVFIGFIIGTVWLVCIIRYFVKIRRDSIFVSAIADKYDTAVLTMRSMFVRRGIKTILAVMCFAVALNTDIYLDAGNYVPDVFCGAAFIAVFILLRRYYTGWKTGIITSAVYSAVSAAGSVMSYSFHNNYTDAQVWKNREAYSAFIRVFPFTVLENILFAVVIVLSLAAVCQIIKNHAGFVPDNMSAEYRESRLKAIRRDLMIKVYICGALALVTALSGIFYDYIITLPKYLISEFWWIVNLILGIAVTVSFISLSSSVSEEVDARYMLD